MKNISVHAVTLVAACLVATTALSTKAQTVGAVKTTQPGTLIATGHTLFLTNCAPCHGAQAQGDDGPNLHKLGLPGDAISSTITTGIKGEMPSFVTKLKGDDLKAVVAYVHSLQ